MAFFVFLPFDLKKEVMIDDAWLRFLARKHVEKGEADMHDIMEFLGIEKLSLEEIHELVVYFSIPYRGPHHISMRVDVEIELVKERETRVLRKGDILNLRAIPEYDELRIRRFIVKLPQTLTGIAERRALEIIRGNHPEALSM